MQNITSINWNDLTENLKASPRMPILFLGHGNPMHAITENPWRENWLSLGTRLPKPEAILVISAHWMSRGVHFVNIAQTPPTIHDFGGFPRALFEQEYPASSADQTTRGDQGQSRASPTSQVTDAMALGQGERGIENNSTNNYAVNLHVIVVKIAKLTNKTFDLILS